MTLLLEAALKVSVVLVLALVTAAALRRRSAAERHCVLAAAVVAIAVLPLTMRIVPGWHVGATTAHIIPAQPSPGVDVSIDATAAPPAVAQPSRPDRQVLSRTSSAIGAAWAIGAVVGLLMLVGGFVRLRTVASRAERVTDERWRERLTALAAEQGIARPVRLLQSKHPSLLVTWGTRRPTIVLPRGAAAWPSARIAVVLRHELAHIRRGDWLVQVVAELVRCAHWFNPLVWLACARVRQESEHACDDAVIGAGVDAAEYAAHLVDLARAMRAERQMWLPAHGIVKPTRLEERIRAMLNARVNRAPMSRTARMGAVAGVFAAAALVAGFGPQNGTVFSGKLVDAMARPLASQVMTLTSVRSHESREATTDSAGAFAFAPLPAGDYTLQVKRLGFQLLEQKITLAGATVAQTIKLQLGTIQESIHVTDAPPPPPPAPPAPPAGKIGPPPLPPAPPAHANWVELRDKIRAKRANDPCATSPEGGCIQAPTKIRDVKPIYPESLKGSGIDGVVVLKGTVATDGAVHGLDVVSAPHADLSAAAITAVGQWLFEPTRLDGTLVETPITIQIAFTATR